MRQVGLGPGGGGSHAGRNAAGCWGELTGEAAPTLHLHPDVGHFSLSQDPTREGWQGGWGRDGGQAVLEPWVGRQEGGLAQPATEVACPPTADTLQTHSGLFLEELEMLVPSTPTSTSGAFWKGSELGSDLPAQPAAPSTTSEVVKSKSASHPAWAGNTYSTFKAQLKHPCPKRLLWNECALAPNSRLSRVGRKEGGKSIRGQTGGHGVGGHP